MNNDADSTPKVASIRQLPTIPKLPPLEIPSGSNTSSNSAARAAFINSRNREDEARSSSTQASDESFATACTSSPIASPSSSAGLINIALPSPSSHSSRILAKSTSVDSFVKDRFVRPPGSPALTGLPYTRSPLEQTFRDSVVDPDMDRWRIQPQRGSTHASGTQTPPSSFAHNKLLQRTRATNKFMTGGDSEESMYEDSEAELSAGNDPQRRRLMSIRETSSRTHSSGIVARSQALSATVSLTNLTPALLAERSHARSTISSNTPSRSNLSSSRAPDATRARSQSLGARMGAVPHEALIFNIAVIGSPGCGKSTFIRKALKRYGLTDPSRCTLNITESTKLRSIGYTRQEAFISGEDHAFAIATYEVSTEELRGEDKKITRAWPTGLPKIDGAFVCYDSSDGRSFAVIPDLLKDLDSQHTPNMVLALRSDLKRAVPPTEALVAITQYSGLVELSSQTERGKQKMRKCMTAFIGAILKGRATGRALMEKGGYRNPASPDVFSAPPLPRDRRSSTTASQSQHNSSPERPKMKRSPSQPTIERANRPPSTPSSPSRTRSMSDLLSESQRVVSEPVSNVQKQLPSTPATDMEQPNGPPGRGQPSSSHAPPKPFPPAPPRATVESAVEDFSSFGDKRDEEQEQPPPPWATFDEILEKLFFLAVSGDDPAFIKHFFLTYRRFATPRSVLLGMQKRMIELNQSPTDSVLSSYAQIRICSLLEQWIADYPSDFAVPGTHGALSALVKQIMKQSHTLYYGSDFYPFLERLPQLVDLDEAWAVKADIIVEESDESDDGLIEDQTVFTGLEEDMPPSTAHPYGIATSTVNEPAIRGRARKTSLPLSLLSSGSTGRMSNSGPPVPPSPKEILARLVRTSQALSSFDALAIAWEITRRELDLFLQIKPRDWLRHTLVSGKKDPENDPIARFNNDYNNLHDWAVSLILCHDKPKARARQIEKFAEVASHLRAHNNYSGLRAMITAINQSTYPGDEPMEIFRANTFLHKKFLSSDVLLRTTGAHQSYRMALKNTKGPCIPSLEVHTSDLRRAHEGNPDFKSDDPSSIHWAKFSMIGKFVSSTIQFQERCQGPLGYSIDKNPQIKQLFDVPLMDYDMQQSRIVPPGDDVDIYTPPIASTVMLESSGQSRDSGIRRLIFW